MKNKIIIGTANFQKKYGINEKNTKKKDIIELLNFGRKKKIFQVDTSPSYEKAENILGEFSKHKFKIYTKIPKLRKNIRSNQIENHIFSQVSQSLKNLKQKKISCIFIQNAKALKSQKGKLIYKTLLSLKKKKKIKKIGISIYDLRLIDFIIKNYRFDVVQAPLNILDQRLIKDGWLKKLKKNKIEVHVRSLFLQGVLFLNSKKLPKKLFRLKKIWRKLDIIKKENSLSNIQLALIPFINNPLIDGFIMGFERKSQLNEVLELNKKKVDFIPKINFNRYSLIDPLKWLKL